jgi:hypothetical protein
MSHWFFSTQSPHFITQIAKKITRELWQWSIMPFNIATPTSILFKMAQQNRIREELQPERTRTKGWKNPKEIELTMAST